MRKMKRIVDLFIGILFMILCPVAAVVGTTEIFKSLATGMFGRGIFGLALCFAAFIAYRSISMFEEESDCESDLEQK